MRTLLDEALKNPTVNRCLDIFLGDPAASTSAGHSASSLLPFFPDSSPPFEPIADIDVEPSQLLSGFNVDDYESALGTDFSPHPNATLHEQELLWDLKSLFEDHPLPTTDTRNDDFVASADLSLGNQRPAVEGLVGISPVQARLVIARFLIPSTFPYNSCDCLDTGIDRHGSAKRWRNDGARSCREAVSVSAERSGFRHGTERGS